MATGIADIAYVPVSLTAEVHPLAQIFNSLFQTEPPSRAKLQKAYEEILEKYPAIQQEFEETGTRMLVIMSLPVYNLHTISKQIRVPDDLKGQRIAAAHGTPTEWVNSISGVAAVNITSGEYYMSLEKSLINGIFNSWEAVNDYKLYEVVKYHTILGENEGGAYSAGIGFQINLQRWNSFSPDIQEILVEAYHTAVMEWIEEGDTKSLSTIEKCKEKGDTIIYLTPEERQLWVEYMKPINEKWIEETEAQGKPAREAYEELIRLFEEYR